MEEKEPEEKKEDESTVDVPDEPRATESVEKDAEQPDVAEERGVEDEKDETMNDADDVEQSVVVQVTEASPMQAEDEVEETQESLDVPVTVPEVNTSSSILTVYLPLLITTSVQPLKHSSILLCVKRLLQLK